MARKKNEVKPKPFVKGKPFIAVTWEEYDADPEGIDKLDNVVLFVDEADRRAWMGEDRFLGGFPDPD